MMNFFSSLEQEEKSVFILITSSINLPLWYSVLNPFMFLWIHADTDVEASDSELEGIGQQFHITSETIVLLLLTNGF